MNMCGISGSKTFSAVSNLFKGFWWVNFGLTLELVRCHLPSCPPGESQRPVPEGCASAMWHWCPSSSTHLAHPNHIGLRWQYTALFLHSPDRFLHPCRVLFYITGLQVATKLCAMMFSVWLLQTFWCHWVCPFQGCLIRSCSCGKNASLIKWAKNLSVNKNIKLGIYVNSLLMN